MLRKDLFHLENANLEQRRTIEYEHQCDTMKRTMNQGFVLFVRSPVRPFVRPSVLSTLN